MKRKKLPSFSSLENKLDKAFSRYIRQRDADEGGTVSCVTCGKLMHWKEAHCGHFIKRQHRSVRWDERNAAAQCVSCNTYRGGQQDEYARFIVERYGLDTFHDLMRSKRILAKNSRDDLLALIERFKA